MNRHRSYHPPNYPAMFTALALGVIVAVSGGIMHAMHRNAQIKADEQVKKAVARIAQLECDIERLEVSQAELICSEDFPERLAAMGSDLGKPGHGDVQIVRPQPADQPVRIIPVIATP